MQPFERMRCGSAALQPLKTPPALVSITSCHSSGLVLVTVLPLKMPALFTSTSRRPNFLTVAVIAASI